MSLSGVISAFINPDESNELIGKIELSVLQMKDRNVRLIEDTLTQKVKIIEQLLQKYDEESKLIGNDQQKSENLKNQFCLLLKL